MTGFLTEYSCPRPDAPGFRLVVGTQSERKSFFFPDPAAVATSGGKLDFDCGPLASPRFARVEFSRAPDTGVDGLLERLKLDEPLPSPVVARTYFPTSIAIDSSGNMYIADKNGSRIRKVTPTGEVSTATGDGTAGFSGDGGLATAAQLKNPLGVAMDASGNLFIADTGNSRIRKVTPAGVIETVAGNGDAGFSGDGGPATLARLSGPASVVVDTADNLFIAESGSNRVRKVGKDGTISTVAGDGVPASSGDGGPAASAQLSFPLGLAVDGKGNLYIADSGNNLVRRITTDGIMTTVAGTPAAETIRGFSGDGGPATSAQLNLPFGVALDAAGNLYIADFGNARVRMVTPAGVITTVAGNGKQVSSGDGGPAMAAQLDAPWQVSVDQGGDLYIVESSGQRVRMVKQGEISTVQGSQAEAVPKPVTTPPATTPAEQQKSVVTAPNCQMGQPEYSDEARRLRHSGTITIEGTVLKDGSVQPNRLVHPLGFGLDERALAAVSLMKCSPALRDGVPIEFLVHVETNFHIR
jgi:TonB family protein